jgi:hypothetical protein
MEVLIAAMKKTLSSENVPLTVQLDTLQTLGALDDFVLPEEAFSPDGNYTLLYGIGFTMWNKIPIWGWLSVERKNISSDRFVLRTEHELADYAGGLNRIQAELICRNDLYASPVSWKLAHTAVDINGGTVSSARMNEEGLIEGNRLTVLRNRKETFKTLQEPAVNSWALLDAISRLPADTSRLNFALLDDFAMIKSGHRLMRTGIQKLRIGREDIPLNGFRHIGSGILPFEYWSDESGRVLFATSEQRLYILDNDAKRKTDRIHQNRRQRAKDYK